MIYKRIKDGKTFILLDSYPLLPSSDGSHDDIDQVVVLTDGSKKFSVTLDSLREDYQDVTQEFKPANITRTITVDLSDAKDESEMVETYDFYRNRTISLTKSGVDIFGITPQELVEASLIDEKLSVDDSYGFWTAATVMPNQVADESAEEGARPILLIELFGKLFIGKLAKEFNFTIEDGKPFPEELIEFVKTEFRIIEQFYQKKNRAGDVIEEQAYYNMYMVSKDEVADGEFAEVDAVETPAVDFEEVESASKKH